MDHLEFCKLSRRRSQTDFSAITMCFLATFLSVRWHLHTSTYIHTALGTKKYAPGRNGMNPLKIACWTHLHKGLAAPVEGGCANGWGLPHLTFPSDEPESRQLQSSSVPHGTKEVSKPRTGSRTSVGLEIHGYPWDVSVSNPRTMGSACRQTS